MRFGQHFIDKNGSGILAFINPHGFLDNPTFRGMRWNLLKTYDKIYTIDLHGNSKKKETAEDGSVDQNVFDIMQGVSINLLIKTGKKKEDELGEVFHFNLFGKREFKYDFLSNNSVKSIAYKKLPNVSPNYFFVSKDFELTEEYNYGFSINELFPTNSVGIVTARDEFTIQNSKEEVIKVIDGFLNLDDEAARIKFNLGKDVRDWQVNFAKKDLENYYPNIERIVDITYRPFDERKTFYTGKSKGFHCYPRNEVMQHFIKGKNLGLVIGRQGQVVGSMPWNLSFITNSITDFNLYYRGGGNVFPLYQYPTNDSQQNLLETSERTPNLNAEIIKEMAKGLGLTFVPEKETESNVCFANSDEVRPEFRLTFAPIDVLDYIYAVLHSPTYREKYKEFLKIDFPRVPYPKASSLSERASGEDFWKLVELGGELRQIHLLESPIVENYITQYPEDGDNIVTKPSYKNGNVYINEMQYFANVPQVAWEFYIGGYQPAQKWLKDRKGRELSYEDILHYQKMIVALAETDRIMKEIDLLTKEL